MLNKDNDKIDGSDKHQIISYVYTLGAKIGGFVYPSENKEFSFDNIGILNREYNKNILEDYSPSIFKYAFLIPNENFKNIKEFANKIKTSEDNFKEKIENKFQLSF